MQLFCYTSITHDLLTGNSLLHYWIQMDQAITTVQQARFVVIACLQLAVKAQPGAWCIWCCLSTVLMSVVSATRDA